MTGLVKPKLNLRSLSFRKRLKLEYKKQELLFLQQVFSSVMPALRIGCDEDFKVKRDNRWSFFDLNRRPNRVSFSMLPFRQQNCNLAN